MNATGNTLLRRIHLAVAQATHHNTWPDNDTVNRRQFLKLTGITGSSFALASLMPAAVAESNAVSAERLIVSRELNAFVSVASDGTITIYSANAEMGQGIKTALPMIIAEEMGANWEDVRVEQSPVDESRFGQQSAGGSTTIPRTWDQMRTMGASAREMFIGAGAIVMEVPRTELRAEDSKVIHTSGQFRTFGQLAGVAAQQSLPDPDTLIFKERQDYRILGKAVSGVDNLAITTGHALFGIDTQVPDMLYAAYHKCPAIGGKVKRANLDDIKAMPGIVDAFTIKGNGDPKQLLDGVAIVGTNTWAVFKAKKALQVDWDERNASKDSWSGMQRAAYALRGKQGEETSVESGNVDAQFNDDANTTHEAFYEYPYVAHLCMEPMNCTAHFKTGKNGGADSIELWLPIQRPSRAYTPLKDLFGLDQEQVTIHQMRLGGSFGRRVYTEYTCEAAAISKRVGAPIKLTWTREDDLHHDFYRVGGFQSVKAAVDRNGKLVAFDNHHIGMQTDGKSVMGSGFFGREFPLLNINNTRVTNTWFDTKTPCGPWRAPYSNTNAFVVQCFLDELAHKAGRDYAEFLIEIMGEPRWFEPGNIRSMNTARAVDVIKKVVKESGWGKTMPAGRGLGLAFHFSHAAHVAEVADVSVDANKKLTVHKVTVAVDVGPIINRSGATSQVAGSVVDGLSVMKGQQITMEAGRIQQSNFDSYPVLRMPDTPEVDIHFIESDNDPTGLGEPALPPLAPAVANAVFAASGHRVRKMPISEEGFS